MKKVGLIFLFIFIAIINSSAQSEEYEENYVLDSIYIQEVEGKSGSEKVLHAEPLYIDLIRDLGARKGEKEWNLGFGLTDNTNYDKYAALVEYEFAPIDRLGLEVELPFSIYYPTNGSKTSPANKLNSIKLAVQYSFFVSEKHKSSMALGYIHEFELVEFRKYGKVGIYNGNLYNPFFVAAKRWGNNFHTLLYSSSSVLQHRKEETLHHSWQINSNLHYMIPGTRNFIGIEFNKNVLRHDFDMVVRPQMRVGLTDNLLVGIVTGIPIKRENERFSTFLRIIYEPKHKVGNRKNV